MTEKPDAASIAPLAFEQVIAPMREKIAAVDQNLIMKVVGVAQALDELRKALDAVDACLDSRDFDKAAALGYSSVSSGFVFLQRTLGGLQVASHDKAAIVSEIAAQMGCAYEAVLPQVNACMESSVPRSKEVLP